MIEILEDEDLLATEDEVNETNDTIMIRKGKDITFVPYVEESNVDK